MVKSEMKVGGIKWTEKFEIQRGRHGERVFGWNERRKEFLGGMNGEKEVFGWKRRRRKFLGGMNDEKNLFEWNKQRNEQ